MPICSTLWVPSRSAYQRLPLGFAPVREQSVAASWIAARRATIHLLAKLAIAATCTSSAAAFDAAHISRMTGVIATRDYLLEHRRREGRPNRSQSMSSAVDQPPYRMAVPGLLAKSPSASQPEAGVQQGEFEELGRQ